MDIFNSIFYFLIVIGILVFIHEWGHFIAARLTGMRAEIFSLGMGRRLLGYNRITGFSFGNLPSNWEGGNYTDYRISILPIGGYVKISGMVDESFDNNFSDSEPKDYEFRSKNYFQKAFVLSAGVLMNFILAVLIFSFQIFSNGEKQIETTTISSIKAGSVAEISGLKAEDKVIEINNKQIQHWGDIEKHLVLSGLGKDRVIKVERDGKITELKMNSKKILDAITNEESLGLTPKNTVVVFSFVETLKPAGEAGFEKADTVISVNGKNINSLYDFSDVIKSNKETPINIMVKRNSRIVEKEVTPNAEGLIGVGIEQSYTGNYKIVEFGIFESLQRGTIYTLDLIDMIINSVVQIFKGNISADKAIGGPIMIAKQSAQQAERGLTFFLNFLASLSISLALINILPIPALDGGHLLMISIEAIYRKELPIKLKLIIQNIGVLLLLSLMVIVIVFDIFR